VEKIQKALEKARQQRGAAQPAAAVGPFRGGASPSASGALAVTYRQTRTVSPTPRLLEKQRVVSGLHRHELADAFRVLRTRVLHRLDAEGWRTLAVTSPNKGAGKTLTAVNLAISVAMNVTRTVLLVDLDLRSPSVHTFFGIPRAPGLQDYLAGDAALAECLVNPGIERLVVLPGGNSLHRSSELLLDPKTAALAGELKSRYPERIVLYDLPPVLVADDAIAFLRHVDACLLVIEDGGTAKSDVIQALELLPPAKLLGTVLNKAKDGATAHYYYY
jgi:capsular exopolysaccharide synthesis family protein